MSLMPDTTMRGSRRCLTKYAREQKEDDDLNVGAAQEAKYHAYNPILKHMIPSRWPVQGRKLRETLLYQAIFTEIMRQPRPPLSKNGSRTSLHEFKPEKVYLFVANCPVGDMIPKIFFAEK